MTLPRTNALPLTATACTLAALSVVAVALAPAPAGADSAGTSRAFLLIAADDRLPSGLSKRVVATGGSITRALQELGVAAAGSCDLRFAARAAVLPGVRSVVPELAGRDARGHSAAGTHPKQIKPSGGPT